MSKAEDVKAAFVDGAGVNNSDVANFTCTNAGAKSQVVPPGFVGQFVRLRPVGTDMAYLFSPVAVAVTHAAATDNGTMSPTQGEFIPAGECREVVIPYAASGVMFFNRLGLTAVGSCEMAKASGRPGNTTDPGQ